MQARNNKVALVCLGFCVVMVAMAYAAVPLYRLFCQVTGFGGTPQQVDMQATQIGERIITVRFDANTAGGLPWQFKPELRTINVKLGQMVEVNYLAHNQAENTTTGTSTFNVFPNEMGAYFNKIDCFCFTEQPLQAGETLKMPLLFYIDPEMDKDETLDKLKEVTLSYTFFPVSAQQTKKKQDATAMQVEQPERQPNQNAKSL